MSRVPFPVGSTKSPQDRHDGFLQAAGAVAIAATSVAAAPTVAAGAAATVGSPAATAGSHKVSQPSPDEIARGWAPSSHAGG